MRYRIILVCLLFSNYCWAQDVSSQEKIKEIEDKAFAIGMNSYKLALEKMSVQDINLLPSGENPKYDAAACVFLKEHSSAEKMIDDKRGIIVRKANWQAKLDLKKSDVSAVNQILSKYASKEIYLLFRLLPDEVMWWIRKDQRLTLMSLVDAVHEAHHALDQVLSYCNDSNATFYFDGEARITELKRGGTENYSIISEGIPEKYGIGTPPNSNYYRYVNNNKLHVNNDFIILLDEFNAYTSTASLDISLTPSELYKKFRSSGITSYGGNLQGMSDFMLYTLCYLQVARMHYPDSYKKIKESPFLLAHIARVWKAAEQTLHDGYKHTVNNGGIYVLQPDLIDTIYSPQFLAELDHLGIAHGNRVDWLNTYFLRLSEKNGIVFN
ncbi:hypothetical protein ACO0K0_05305 [Undibacterium sp. SXout11W]|uniref:hypothetical protein n=1 Tax=Undibacterium sp. SXout11W TaxID=3413050 RepID=UPI003BEF9F88